MSSLIDHHFSEEEEEENCHRGHGDIFKPFDKRMNSLQTPAMTARISFFWQFAPPSIPFLTFIPFPQIQFADAEQSYRSDCETDDGISAANYNEYLNGAQQQPTSRRKNRSPLTMRQGPQMSSDINNRRLQQYNSSQERLRNGESGGSFVTQFVESWIGALFSTK